MLAVGRVVFDDLFGWDEDPIVLQPRVPATLRISFAASLNLELRLDGISDTATKERFAVRLAVGMPTIVRALEILKLSLVGAVRPLSTGEKF
jgi:hypothetical protein